MNLDGPREAVPPKDRPFADRWILSRLNRTIREVAASLEHYRFDQAAGRLYQFIWHEYCDWYLEMIKPVLQSKDTVDARKTRQTLVDTFETVQRILHPFMPFITEEIWQTLPHVGESIVTQPYPVPRSEWDAKDIENAFAVLERFVATARTGRSLLNYQPGKVIAAYGTSTDRAELATLQELAPHLGHLGKATVQLQPLAQWPARNVLRLIIGGLTVGIAVEGDVDLRKALERIKKQRDENAKESSRIEGKLGNTEFTAKAPPDVVAEHTQRLHTLRQEQEMLAGSERQLREMMT